MRETSMDMEKAMRAEDFKEKRGSRHENLVEGGGRGSVTEQKKRAEQANQILNQPFWKKRFMYFLADKPRAQVEKQTYQETVQGIAAIRAEAEQYMDEFHQDANDLVASRQGYEELQAQFAQQLGVNPNVAKMSRYVSRVSNMTRHFVDFKLPEGQVPPYVYSKEAEGMVKNPDLTEEQIEASKAELYKSAGKQAAVEDFFLQPNSESPHMKEPRMDIMMDLPQALEKSKAIGAKNILKVTIIPSTRYGVGEPQYKYVPVPENTADIVKVTVESMAMHGRIYPPKEERDRGNDTTVSFGYEMIPVNAVETELKPKLARVTFEVIGRGGSKTVSEFEITDVNLKTLQQRVEGRLFTDYYGGQQKDKTVIVNASVDLDGEKMSLEEFLTRKTEAA